MLTEAQIKDTVTGFIINSIEKYAEGRKKRTAKFQVLDLIMPYERNIRSIVGGLETSFGVTLWEKLAEELASKNGFTIKDKKDHVMPADLHPGLKEIFQKVHDDRKNGQGKYDALTSHQAIKGACACLSNSPVEIFVTPPSGHGIDVWLEKNGVDYWLDLKTVQPNVGSYQRFLLQILDWFSYYYSRWPEGNLEARIVFPYNPHSGAFWDKTHDGGFPLEKEKEAWVADDFWDFLTGNTGSTEIILSSFREIAAKGLVTKVLEDLFSTD